MPKLEEIEDIDDVDNLDMDLAEFDPSLRTPIAPAKPAPSVVRSQDSNTNTTEPPLFPGMNSNPFMAEMFKKLQQTQEGEADDGSGSMAPQAQAAAAREPQYTEEQLEKIQKMEVIYPCYFDANRSHKQGRKVDLNNAVSNPLAKTLYDACLSLKIPVIFEANKTHPQDFGNPGRVRVQRKHESNAPPTDLKQLPKRAMYKAIAEYMQEHETTWRKVQELRGPRELDGYKGQNVPKVKGYKMNEIVPLHSPMLYQNPATDVIYKKEFLEKPKPLAQQQQQQVTPGPQKPKQKYMQIRR